MADITIILFMLIGNILATLVPYFRKLSEGTIASFDAKYLYQLVGASVWQFILTVPVLELWTSPSGFEDSFSEYLQALFFGIGGYKLQAEVIKILKPNIPISSPPAAG